MRLSLLVLWLIVGGSIKWPYRPWEWWLARLREPIKPPDPPPHLPKGPPRRPDWPLVRVIGVVGGVIGGWVFTEVFGPGPVPWFSTGPHPDPWMPVVFAAATTVGAFIGASLLTDLYALVREIGKPTRG